MDKLEVLLNPKSVAVIGASANPAKWGEWIAEQVIAHEELRTVYFVNPRGEIIYGKQSLTSVSQIPEPVDVAVVAVPNKLFETTIDQLLVNGAKVIVGITVGFSEVGSMEIEKRIAEKVKQAGSILIGPNCAGVWDGYSNFHCLPIAKFKPGPVGFISQSGGIITDVFCRLQEVKLGYSRVISTGNQAGVTINDLLKTFDSDPNTKVIALYVEDELSIPYYMFKEISKPIILLTPNSTAASKRAAKQHTNSKLSDTQCVEEATISNGAYFAHSVSELIGLIQIALQNTKIKGKRIVIATDSGGMGVLTAAMAEQQGLIVDQPSPDLKINIKQEIGRLLPLATIDNPIDLISIPGGFSEATIKLLQVLQSSSEIEAIIMILFLIETQKPSAEDYECGLKLAACLSKRTVFVCKDFSFPGTQALLDQQVPVYRDVEIAVKAIKAICGS